MYKGNLHEFEGQLLSIKMIAGKVNLAPSTIYKYLNQGFSLYDAIDMGKKQSKKVFKNRAKTNNRVARKYPYLDGEYTVEEIAKLESISEEPLYRRLAKGMTPKEAVLEIKSNISKKYPYKGIKASLYKISMISGVPKYYLNKVIDPDKEYSEEELEKIISSYQKPPVLMVGEETLFQYCLKNQYNYNVIYYAIKVNGYRVEDAIYNYIKEGQSDHFAYTFGLGEILLLHFCIKYRLDNRYINDRMRKGDSIEDAIQACIFLVGENYETREKRNELYKRYRELGYELSIKDLPDKDKEFIIFKHQTVVEIFRKYKLYQVVSLLSTEMTEKDRLVVMNTFDVTEEDLLGYQEDLFDGFVEIDSKDAVSYIWRGREQK